MSDFNLYTVPKTGFYEIYAKGTILVYTGKKELRKNYEKKWYEFWKPKLALSTVFEQKEICYKKHIKFLKNGEAIAVDSILNSVSLKN